jgi:hypothetical protein
MGFLKVNRNCGLGGGGLLPCPDNPEGLSAVALPCPDGSRKLVESPLPCPDISRDFSASGRPEFSAGPAGEGEVLDMRIGPASALAEASFGGMFPCPDDSLVGNDPPGMPGVEGGAVRARLRVTGEGDFDVSESAGGRGTGARASRRPLVLRLEWGSTGAAPRPGGGTRLQVRVAGGGLSIWTSSSCSIGYSSPAPDLVITGMW